MIILAAIAVVLILMVLRGFVIQDMFNWFIVPTFQIDPIGFWMALGISGTVALMTYEFNSSEGDDGVIEVLFKGVFINVLIWGFGWFYQAMM